MNKTCRRWLAGAVLAVIVLAALAWTWYGVRQTADGRSRYEQINDEYSQVVDPADPSAGLVQTFAWEKGGALYGVRLLFSIHGRVAHGTLYAELQDSAGTRLAGAACDMTALLDNTFYTFIFEEGPVNLTAGESYRLRVWYQPATAEDVVGLWASETVLTDMPLTGGTADSGTGTAALQLVTDHSGGFASRAFWVPGALLALAVLGGWWLLFVKKAGAVPVFCVAGALLGLVMSLIIPPLAGPDEYAHAATAYAQASELLGQAPYDEQGRLRMRECDAPYMTDETGERGVFAYKRMAGQLLETGHDGALTAVAEDVRAAASGNRLLYAPMVLGMALGRVLGLSFYGMLWLARLCNLAVYLALAALALHLTPRAKNVFFCAALLPMALQVAGCLSADMPVMALTLLWMAWCLRGCAGPVTTAGWLAGMLLAALLAPAKAIYLPLTGLCLVIPGANLGARPGWKKTAILGAAALSWAAANASYFGYLMRDMPDAAFWLGGAAAVAAAVIGLCAARLWERRPAARRWILLVGVALALVALAALFWMASHWGEDPTPQQLVEGIQPNGDSIYTYSVGYILRNLPRVVKLTVATFAAKLPAYWQQALGTALGEPVIYSVEVSWLLTLALTGVLWLAAMPAADSPRRLPGWRLWWVLALCAGCVALCVAACLTWTPLNYEQIFGIQGRYFLPLVPLLALAAGEWRGVVRSRDLSAGVRLAQIGLCAAVLLEAISQLAAL